MTDQVAAVDAEQAEYNAALALMSEGSHDKAQAGFEALIAKYKAAPDTIRAELAADAMCTLACSERDNGQIEDALHSFKMTSMMFGYGSHEEARYVAGIADLLASKLYYEQGRPQVAHALLDNMTLRIMMEEHARFRALFTEASAQKTALERLHGFEPGVGIRMERYEIGNDDRMFDPLKPVPQLDMPDLDPVEPVEAPPPAVPTLFDPPEPVAPVRPDVADDDYRYEKIESKFETAPHSWQLAPDGLVVTRAGQAFTIPYAQVTRLTLRFVPTRLKARRYTVRVQARSGVGAEIDNMSFAGIANFEDRSFKYALLVHGLSQKLAAAGSQCEVVGGVSWPFYLFAVGAGVFSALMVLLTFLIGGPVVILIKAALIVVYLPRMVRWIRRNRPARGTLTALPSGTVPPLVA